MSKLPPPPVPQKLRELLKDYPGYIERLQERLDAYVRKPAYLMLFDGAIWALEGRLETFMSEASAELAEAKASGDTQAIARAEAKERLMFRAGSRNGGMRNLQELKLYFDAHKEKF